MIDKIKTLVIAKHFILKSFVDFIYEDSSEKSNEDFHKKWSKYFKVISELLDINIETKELFNEDFNIDEIISSHIKSSVYEDVLVYDINEKFGSEIKLFYCTLSTITTLQYVCSFHTYGNIIDNTPEKRKEIIQKEINEGNEFIEFYKNNFSEINFTHFKYFSYKTITLFKKLNITLKEESTNHIEIHKLSSDIINEIFPRFQEINFHLNIAEELIQEIENCKPGIKNWNKYEKICLDVLRFLFIPEFDFIYTQKRTESGHQIRDAIIPNNQDLGFWKNIKDEFSSKI